jgi:hypothetical protein
VAKSVNALAHLFLKILASACPGKSRITFVIQMVRYNWIPNVLLEERFLQPRPRENGEPSSGFLEIPHSVKGWSVRSIRGSQTHHAAILIEAYAKRRGQRRTGSKACGSFIQGLL